MCNIQTEEERLKARMPQHFALGEVRNVAAFVGEDYVPRSEALYHLMLGDDDMNVRRKAAWIMGKLAEGPMGLPPCVRWQDAQAALLDEGHADSGWKRLLLDVMMMLPVPEPFPVNFYDWCLEHAFLPQEKPAVQALCLKHVRRLCDLQPELLQEVRAIMADFDEGLYSPALRSVVRRRKIGR
jgi:hypothetical protein